MDITTIPKRELIDDLLDANIDIGVCKTALKVDITTWSQGSVADRLAENKRQVKVIEAELDRRAALPDDGELGTKSRVNAHLRGQ